MIAGEEIGLQPAVTVGAKPFDHAPGVRSAVDQVAQEDQQRLASGTALSVLFNHREDLVEQIEPAMDIADRIGPKTTRSARLRGRTGSLPEHQFPLTLISPASCVNAS